MEKGMRPSLKSFAISYGGMPYRGEGGGGYQSVIVLVNLTRLFFFYLFEEDAPESACAGRYAFATSTSVE
jgi:hypothetical protein